MNAKLSKVLTAGIEVLKTSFDPMLIEVSQMFLGQTIDDGADVLSQVQAYFATKFDYIIIEIATPASYKHLKHFFVTQTLLGDLTSGAYLLTVYAWGQYLYPVIYIHPTSATAKYGGFLLYKLGYY